MGQARNDCARRAAPLAAAIVTVLTLASCVGQISSVAVSMEQNGQRAAEPKRGEPFELKANETRNLTDENLRVRFNGVKEDSRCPIGVQCIWAGDAVVEVTLEKPGTAADTRELHTSERFARETEYGGLVIRLLEVQPHPREGVTIAPGDYRAKLVVDSKR
jgi:hypothetical protein